MQRALPWPGGSAPALAKVLTSDAPQPVKITELWSCRVKSNGLQGGPTPDCTIQPRGGNVCFLVPPCQVLKPPIVSQHPTFSPIFIYPLLQSQPFWLQSGTRASTSVVFEETKPSAMASILHFWVFYKHTKGGAPARLITAISNSNTTKGVHSLSQSVPVYAIVPKKLLIATPPSLSGGDDTMISLATAHISCFRKPPSN